MLQAVVRALTRTSATHQGFCSMSKRPRESLKVLMIMDASTHNGTVLERCMREHTNQPGNSVEYMVANELGSITQEQAAAVEVLVHAVFAGGKAAVIGELWPSMPNLKWASPPPIPQSG